jgi:hypothetical protein
VREWLTVSRPVFGAPCWGRVRRSALKEAGFARLTLQRLHTVRVGGRTSRSLASRSRWTVGPLGASRNGDYGDLAPEDIRETVPVTVDRFDQLGPERLGRR